jgi:hypothetical protein
MSTRKTFAHAIAGRARRIGWKVEMLKSGGWVITCPDNFRVQVHLTPSDRNHEATVIRELNNHGFEEAEQEWLNLKEEDRLQKLRESAEAEQRALDKAQQHADAVARATGQTRVGPEVLLNPYPLPKTFERVLVTPELANKLLDLNTENRPIRQREVLLWAGIIKRGEWLYTHQGIAIDNRGILQDGQHRLSGIVQTGISCEMQISIGMAPENFNAIDNGLRRTFGDVAANMGLHTNRNRVGTAARMLTLYDGWPERARTEKVNNTEVAHILGHQFDDTRTVGDVIYAATARAQALWAACRLNVSAATTGIYLLWFKVGEDHPLVHEFLDGLLKGSNMDEDDPRFVLRRYVMSPSNKRRDAWLHLSLFIKAWNKFVQGKRVQNLFFRKDEDLPKVLVPKAEEG